MAEYEVRIYDTNLQLVDIIEDYKYLNWTRKWQTGNNFSLSINHYSKSVKYLNEDYYIDIWRNGSREFIGIIEHKNIELNQDGKITENWEIKGKTILSRRICLPSSDSAYDEIEDNGETVLKHYVDSNIINPADPNRKIDVLINETNQNRGSSISIRARYDDLVDKLEEAAVASELGYEIVFDGTNLIFQIIQGTDKSSAQSSIAPVIFSPDFGNIKLQNYQWSKLDRFNMLYVAGQGEGSARTIEGVFNEASEPSGLDRKESFIDARDLDTSSKLVQRGETKINEQGPATIFETEILDHGPFKYRDDWDLGDIITVRNIEWDILAHLRIQQVSVSIDSNNENIQVAFGSPYPNFIQKMQRELSKTSQILRM